MTIKINGRSRTQTIKIKRDERSGGLKDLEPEDFKLWAFYKAY